MLCANQRAAGWEEYGKGTTCPISVYRLDYWPGGGGTKESHQIIYAPGNTGQLAAGPGSCYWRFGQFAVLPSYSDGYAGLPICRHAVRNKRKRLFPGHVCSILPSVCPSLACVSTELCN